VSHSAKHPFIVIGFVPVANTNTYMSRMKGICGSGGSEEGKQPGNELF
jgi:hypothetical protein